MSLAAIGFLSLDIETRMAWRLASVVGIVLLAAIALLARHEDRTRGVAPDGLGRGIQWMAWGFGVVAALAFLSNTVAFPYPTSFFAFYLGLFSLVVITAAEFLYLVYSLLRVRQ